MSWIQTIPEGSAAGPLAELYGGMLDAESGKVDNILKVHSLHPAGLAAHWGLYRAAMRGTPGLRLRDRELIAVVVSKRNGCHY